jgi:trigger factor
LEINISSESDVLQTADIKLTREELVPHFEKAMKKFRADYQMPGFRKGKVPIDFIKRLFGEAIEQKTLDDIANEFFHKAMEEKTIKPIGEPSLTDLKYDREGGFQFKVKYELYPKVELKEYTGIAVDKPVHSVTDEDIKNDLLRFRRIESTTQEVDEVTDDEHIVIVDWQEVDKNGTPLIGRIDNDLRYYLADPNIEPEVKEALRIAKIGGEFRVTLKEPEGSQMEPINAILKVKKINKVILPELNDELVKKVSRNKYTTVTDFIEGRRRDLEELFKEQSQRAMMNILVSEIVRRNDFAVPDSMVKKLLDARVEEIKAQYKNKELPADFDRTKFDEENKADAVFQIKWLLLREKLIEQEKIEAVQTDYEKLAEKESARVGIDKEKLIKYYSESEKAKEKIVADKLLEFLEKNSKIKEVKV